MPKKKSTDKSKNQSKAKARIQRTEVYAQKVKREFSDAVNSILALKKKKPDLADGVMYSFDGDTKKVQGKVTEILRKLHSATVASIQNGIEQEWNTANKEVDDLLASTWGKSVLSNPNLAGWFDRNEKAMTAFAKRTENGFNLSKSIWKDTQQLREEMEVAMTVAIGEGQSASQISRKVRQYLDDPDLMFRRFRYKDENGKWRKKWKKRVRDDNGKYHFIDYDRNSYKTGAGVYKSSYRNAMRVARTETNMAYRRADNDRWSRLDFVLGQHIELSRSHPKEDICDELQGDYPKDFLFEGWHPQCFCICTSILPSEEEMEKRLEAAVKGEEYTPTSKPITTYPKGFQKFIERNADNIKDAMNKGTAPYFIVNNQKVVDRILDGENLTEEGGLYAKPMAEREMSTIDKENISKAEKKFSNARELFNEGLDSHDIYSAAQNYGWSIEEMESLSREEQIQRLEELIEEIGKLGGSIPQVETRMYKMALEDLRKGKNLLDNRQQEPQPVIPKQEEAPKQMDEELQRLEKEVESMYSEDLDMHKGGLSMIESKNKDRDYLIKTKDDGSQFGEKREVKAMKIQRYETRAGIAIRIPSSDTVKTRQLYTVEQIAESLDRLPPIIRSVVREVDLCDFRNPNDAYWEKAYKMKGFRSYATGGGGVINFYENGDHRNADEYLMKTLLHEAGHNLDGFLERISSEEVWKDAVEYDLRHGVGLTAVTDYGKVNAREDFADAVALYVLDTESFRRRFPARAAIISILLR